jgi:hypothetical protein
VLASAFAAKPAAAAPAVAEAKAAPPLHGQGSKKSIILPNSEVIHDLNGEWDVIIEGYGEWIALGSWPQICKITQEGSSFVSVRMIDDPYNQKGSQNLRGELDKNGFKKVQIVFTAMGPIDAKGVISKDGNKMIIDDGEKVRSTYTRKK